MCAMFADFEECLRPACTNCHAMPGPGGLCRICAREALAGATGAGGLNLGSSSASNGGGAGGLGTQVPEAMISSATSDEVRQLTWIEVEVFGFQDLTPPDAEDQAPASVEPDIWELLPDAAVAVLSPERSSIGHVAPADFLSSSGGAVSSTASVDEDEAARRPHEETASTWEQVPVVEPLNVSWQESLSPPRQVPAAVSEPLADSWEETPSDRGPELWSVVPAEVLASSERRRSDLDAQGGEGAAVQHVIAGGIIVENSEATESSTPVLPHWTEFANDVHEADEALLHNSSPESAMRRRCGDNTVDLEAPAASSSELPALGQSLCIVCVKAAAVATFVHGLTGHTACCLPCAQEVQRRGCSCPVCRLPFTSVIRNFVTT